MNTVHQTIELLPPAYATRWAIRRRIVLWALLAAAVATASGGMVVRQYSARMALEDHLASQRAEAAMLGPLENSVASLATRLRNHVDTVTVISRVRSEPAWAFLISDLCEAAEHDVFFSSLEFEQNTDLEYEPAEESRTLRVLGAAIHDAAFYAFVEKLENANWIRDIDFRVSRTTVAGFPYELTGFSLDARVTPESLDR